MTAATPTAKHTPGPWSAELNSGDGITAYALLKHGRKVVGWTGCTRNRSNGDVLDEAEAQANGRLLVASPELLEAVRVMEAFITDAIASNGDARDSDAQLRPDGSYTLNHVRALLSRIDGV